MAAPLATAFPGYGTLAIGGYTFTNFSETAVNVQPVPSLDGRSVSYSKITIDIHAKLVGDIGAAALEVAFAIPRLQKSGVTIVYRGRGLDRLFAGFGRDISWGPIPGSFRIKPLGSVPANAFDVRFSIEAKVPTCPTARFTGPIDMATTITFDVDYAGYLTRTYSGRLRIANNLRPDGMGGTDSPDLYREDVTPDPLPGFYRKFGPFVTSEDRTELSFSIRDEELPGLNVPPEWVVGEPVLSHRVQSVSVTGKPSLKNFIAHFSGHYELSKDAPDSNWPALHFFDVFVNSRLDILLKSLAANKGTGTPGAVVPIALDFGEPNVLGRRVFDFSCSFSYVDDVWTVLGNSGAWAALPGNSWPTWARSLSTSAFSPWGTSEAYFDIGDDRTITGLCSAPAVPSAGGDGFSTLRTPGQGLDPTNWIDRALKNVRPDASWMEYENNLSLVPETGTVVLRTLPTKPAPALPAPGQPAAPNTGHWAAFDKLLGEKFDAMNGGTTMPGAGDVINPGSQNPISRDPGGAKVIQKRVPDSFKIVMEGHALRAGFQIPPPTLTVVGGTACVPLYDKDRDFWKHSIVANAGVPIYGASWRFTFITHWPIKAPIGPAPNPMLGTSTAA